MSEANAQRQRADIGAQHKWNLDDIFTSWEDWQSAYDDLAAKIETYAGYRGSLQQGAEQLLRVLALADEAGQLAYRVWYYPSLMYDEDQRDNEINAKRQEVQILIAKWQQAGAWFNPELLGIPLEELNTWLEGSEELAVYRFSLTEIYRQQEHVLDDSGEKLLSYSASFNSTPSDAYAALTTADMSFPTITLSDGEDVKVTYGQYRKILSTRRVQADRAGAFEAIYDKYGEQINTYAALYNGVAQKDWFHAQARKYDSTLAGALHGNNIPKEVVETLISATRAGVEPLKRYHRLRKKMLGVEKYHLYDSSIPLVESTRVYPYDQVQDWVVDSVAVLGDEYQSLMRKSFADRWIDVYENEGKRSGAYSASVYGVHPYMLLNYNDTLDDVFTLAHEVGHSMHTIYANRTQPFVYAGYTIFVAEVPSTLSEALLLKHLLKLNDDPRERAVLLQHAIDSICGTFYTQVLFANWELEAHRLVEAGKPITADSLGALYTELLDAFYGDVISIDERYARTWARIPHFFRSPYYVYQYATCFASSAKLLAQIEEGGTAGIGQFLDLLRAGGSDHPMALLQTAGVDLREATTVNAVIGQLDALVTQLEVELGQLENPEPKT
jgi:oligoendopeptidase F